MIVLSIALETTTPRRSCRRPRSESGFGSRLIGLRSPDAHGEPSGADAAPHVGGACASASAATVAGALQAALPRPPALPQELRPLRPPLREHPRARALLLRRAREPTPPPELPRPELPRLELPRLELPRRPALRRPALPQELPRR